jgi:hypothetical protein
VVVDREALHARAPRDVGDRGAADADFLVQLGGSRGDARVRGLL